MQKIQQLHTTWASPYRDMGYYIFTLSTCPSSQFRHCSSTSLSCTAVLSKILVVFYVWGIWGICVSRLPRTTIDNHVSTSLFFFSKKKRSTLGRPLGHYLLKTSVQRGLSSSGYTQYFPLGSVLLSRCLSKYCLVTSGTSNTTKG